MCSRNHLHKMEAWKYSIFYYSFGIIFELFILLLQTSAYFQNIDSLGVKCIVKALGNKIWQGKRNENVGDNMCTTIFITSLPTSDESLWDVFPVSFSAAAGLHFSNVSSWDMDFPDLFYPKYMQPCSIVIYEHANFTKISKKWLSFVPGSNNEAFHLIFIENQGSLPKLEDMSPTLKSILHLLLIFPDEASNFHLVTLGATSKEIVKVGVIHGSLYKTWCLLNPQDLLNFSRWNLKGDSLLVAMAGRLNAPTQQDFESMRNNENSRDHLIQTKNYFTSLIYMIRLFVEDGVNGTVAVTSFDTATFGKYDSVAKKWVGLIKEVMDENAHTCIGLAATQEGAQVVTQADAFLYDDISFITSLPRQSSGSMFFFFESFQLNVWIIFTFLGTFVIGVLFRFNRNKLSSILSLVLKPLLDQSSESENLVFGKYVDQSGGTRIILGSWLLSVIVIGSMFKSKLTAELINPVIIYPPETMWELAKSDYTIGTIYYSEMEFESVILQMQNLELVRKLEAKFVHYNHTMTDKCFLKLLEGHYACMGLKVFLKPFAQVLLRYEDGQNRYQFSKDILSVRLVIPVITNSMAQILDNPRSSSFQRNSGLGTRRRKKNKSASSATAFTVNQATESEERSEGKERRVNSVVTLNSHKKNSIPFSSRCQYHASFVLKRPTGSSRGKAGIILESSKSFDSVQGCSFYSNKPNQQDYYQKKEPNDNQESHESAQCFECQFDPVMTWFKEPSGAEDPHANNIGSGMGANGSSHVGDGRLKSRSQSSSALYCIGKSGNGSVIEAGGNYGNHNNYSNCHSNGANGLSSSIPADIWDLPCTAKSYSPVSSAKQNRQNISHYYPENYHLDSHLSSGTATTGGPSTDVETVTGSSNNQVGHPPGLAIGTNSATTGANSVPVGQISSRSGKKEKGNKKSGKSNNRAKLYAVSCPDVAEHTENCGNLPAHSITHHHSQHQFDFTGDPRFIGINEAVAEELDSSCTSIGTGAVAMTGSSFADVRPYPLQRNPGATTTSTTSDRNNTSAGRSNLNSHNHMAQSHPHLYATSSVNNSGVSNVAPIVNMETAYHGPGIIGAPLFYSQQELQHFQQQLMQPTTNNSHPQQYVQPSALYHSGRTGSSRSSHHSRSYQNLPCSAQQQQYSSGSSAINQHFNLPGTSSSTQQPLYNQQFPKQISHTSSTRSRRSVVIGATGDTKCSQFQIPHFVSPDHVFEVRLIRDHRGLGLSVTGGLDSQETYPGLIRVKKVFPMGPAYESGELQPYDIILEANGVPLSGLTNHEALEVLRTTPTETLLIICRPPINIPGFHDSSLSRSTDLSKAHLQSQSQPALNQLTGNGSQYQSQQLVCSNNGSSHHNHNQQAHQTKPVKKTCVQCGGVQRHPPDKSNSTASTTSTSLNPSVKSKSLSSLKLPPPTQTQEPIGEFEVTLEKINGSLGFTLRQEDSSVLGHYVRALVKDPALSDGRIRPGDRIIAVNGQDLSEMSHADAINFLRSCPLQVTLRLYRDVSPTPISPLSPTESHKSLKPKPLRKEAIDMLNDLAVRKQMSMSSNPGSDPKHSLPGSVAGRTGLRGHRTLNQDVNGPATLPRRRLQHAGVTPSPEVLSAALSHFAGKAPMKSSKKNTQQELPSATTPPASNNSSSSGGSSGYRSSASRLTAANNSSSSTYPTETRSSGSGESTPVGTITGKHGKKTDLYRNYSDLRSAINLEEDDDDDGIFKDDDEEASPGGSSSVLDKDESESEQVTPKARKPSFRQFTLHLDKISSLEDDDSITSDLQHHDSIVSEPGYPATDTEMGDGSNFKHGQPAYQSAILSSNTAGPKSRGKGNKLNKEAFGSAFRIAGGDSPTALSDADIPSTLSSNTLKTSEQGKDSTKSSAKEPSPSTSASDSTNSGGLVKWKGVVFSLDDEEGGESTEDLVDSRDSSFRHPVGTSGDSTESRMSINEDSEEPGNSAMFLNANHPLPQRRSPDGREFRECDTEVVNINQCNGEQIFTVQLSRRWCSRLGFSLQGSDGGTYISAIYPESVAAKDGRLRVGDELIMINGETVRGRSTAEVIDMMRKIRGVISITLHRRPNVEPEFDPKDHELGLT